MIRTPFVAARVVAFALLLGTAAFPLTSASALPHLGVHRHPVDPNDCRVSLVIYNKGASFRDVRIGEHVYTVLPHQTLSVKAPEGTAIYTNTTGAMHRKGDLLFSVTRGMQNKTVPIS